MNRNEMLRKVQMLGFVLTEVNLFLNTHPEDVAALRFHDKYNALHREAVSEYEYNFGPLTAGGVKTEEGWSWVNSPWPWELEG